VQNETESMDWLRPTPNLATCWYWTLAAKL